MKKEPTKTFLSELWGFKVNKGEVESNPLPPYNVGLKQATIWIYSWLWNYIRELSVFAHNGPGKEIVSSLYIAVHWYEWNPVRWRKDVTK